MAKKTTRQSSRGSSGIIFTALYLASMVIYYIGERLVLESTTLRFVLAGLATVGVVLAIIGRVQRRSRVPLQLANVLARRVRREPDRLHPLALDDDHRLDMRRAIGSHRTDHRDLRALEQRQRRFTHIVLSHRVHSSSGTWAWGQ